VLLPPIPSFLIGKIWGARLQTVIRKPALSMRIIWSIRSNGPQIHATQLVQETRPGFFFQRVWWCWWRSVKYKVPFREGILNIQSSVVVFDSKLFGGIGFSAGSCILVRRVGSSQICPHDCHAGIFRYQMNLHYVSFANSLHYCPSILSIFDIFL
jgi:hypothetical protein